MDAQWTVFVLVLCAKMVQPNRFWVTMRKRYDRTSTYVLSDLTSDVIKDMDQRVSEIEYVRLNNFRSASFEIGFLNYLIIEEYRKMVDKYNTSVSMDKGLYPMEVVLYLMEIETHYWQIKHLVNMQHEIQRKYRVPGGPSGKPDYVLPPEGSNDPSKKKFKKQRMPNDKETQMMDKILSLLQYGTTKKRSTRWWWPIEYGWEIEKWW